MVRAFSRTGSSGVGTSGSDLAVIGCNGTETGATGGLLVDRPVLD
jgi:hypothetical protein